MKPVKISHDLQGDLFKTELLRIIDLNHPLVRLAKKSTGAGSTNCSGKPIAMTTVVRQQAPGCWLRCTI